MVELSIVLAILGILIVVGISGRSLIDISRATATVEYLGNRAIAFQTFETTYSCLPGDCSLTTVTGSTGSLSTTGVGNGNTKIEAYVASGPNDEIGFVEEHFYKAQLFTRPITVVATGSEDLTKILPVAKVPGSYVSSFTIGTDTYNVIGNAASADAINGAPVLYSSIFRIIDSKLDDGDATNGSTRCETAALTPTTTALAGTTAYNAMTTGCVLVSKI